MGRFHGGFSVGLKTLAKIRRTHTPRGLSTKVRIKRRTAGASRGEDVPSVRDAHRLSYPEPATGGVGDTPDEKVKTSIVTLRSLVVRCQDRARAMNLSFNGFVNMALYDRLDGPTSRRPLPPEVQAIITTRPPRPPRQDRSGSPVGEGFTRVAESKEEHDCFVTWPVVQRYAKKNLKHPTEGPMEMARRLGITIDEALAADIAMQTPEFERWATWARTQPLPATT